MRRGWRRTIVTAAAVVAVVAAVPAAGASNAPLLYTFTKTCTIGVPISVCTGSATGDVSGTLTSVEEQVARWSDGIGHITFLETIGADTMRVTGTFNSHTLTMVLNGQVIAGPNEGARTHHRAHVVRFEGGGSLAVIEGEGFVLPQTAG